MISRYASLRQGLVGAWCPSVQRCGSGFTLPDLSGYNNHGVLTNMDPATAWVPSGSGISLNFDGINDYVTLESPQKPFNQQYSIACWVQSTTPGASYRGVMVKQGTCGIFLNGGVLSSYDWGTSTERSTGITISDGYWHHVVLVFNNSVASGSAIFLDGNKVLTTTYTYSYATRLVIGSGGWNVVPEQGTTHQNINAKIDSIMAYSRLLNNNEIQLLYTGGRGVGLAPERIKHRRKTTAAFKAAWARRQQHIGSGVY